MRSEFHSRTCDVCGAAAVGSTEYDFSGWTTASAWEGGVAVNDDGEATHLTDDGVLLAEVDACPDCGLAAMRLLIERGPA